jgi:hypothetical protein
MFELILESKPHQDFDGLKMVVRFEVDACLPLSKTTTAQGSEAANSRPPKATDVDDLSQLLSSAHITPDPPSTHKMHGISYRTAGTLVPQQSLIELTTRSARNIISFNWAEALPQLWLSRTANHILAVHERGTFTSVTRRSLEGSAELRAATAGAQLSFKKLRRVLDAIQELLVERGREARLTLVCRNGVLEVFERTDDWSVLPKEVLKRFG